ncbi:MAG: ribosome-associated translation inhibitor RaiA [Candidatus Brocadiia bacterium]
MIPLKLTVRHSKITGEFKEYATQKPEKLHKYLDRIGHMEIILDHAKNNFIVEIIVSTSRGRKLVAKSLDQNYFTALDVTIDKLETQLTKFKEKLKDSKRKGDAIDFVDAQEFGSGLEQNDWY